jgi:photosystem II stability/assembly factor-like uncharacterized protein
MTQKKKKAAGNVFVTVATEKGGYILSSDPTRKSWKRTGPLLKKESVNSMTYNPKRRELYAATLTSGVFVSRDMGRTWKQINDGLHVKKVWTIEVDPKNASRLYAGTHYGHLFRSEDAGASWSEVTGLHTAPGRNEWGVDWAFGTTGLTIHTIRLHPTKNRIYVVASGKGLYRSDDGGEKWSVLKSGVVSGCPATEKKDLEQHLEQVHTCTHKVSVSRENPDVLYQQNHCGVYVSTDGGDAWSDISPSRKLRHGFSIVLVGGEETKGETAFTVPAFQGACKKHNSCIVGPLAAYRFSSESGEWKKLTGGLPPDVHTCVLRDAMATDSMDYGDTGVYFGTTTGEVYGTIDDGRSWNLLSHELGRIQGVSSFVS